MNDDFSKYEEMKISGSSAGDVYREAIGDGLDPIVRIRLIRGVYSLSPRQAKEVVEASESGTGSIARPRSEVSSDLPS